MQPPQTLFQGSGSRVNILKPRQNDQCFADDIFKFIFLNENYCILFQISFVPRDPINNMPLSVQILPIRCQLGKKAIIWTNDGLF